MKTLNQVKNAEKVIAATPIINKKISMTPLEKDINHKKKRLIYNFVREIGWVVKEGMSGPISKLSYIQSMNLLCSWNQNIIIGDYPNFKIDLKKVVISKGNLSKPENATVKLRTKLKVEQTWNKTLGENGKATDQMCWMIYNVSNQESILITSETLRCSGKDTLTLQIPNIAGDELHYWMYFISENGKKRSDSVYLGILE